MTVNANAATPCTYATVRAASASRFASRFGRFSGWIAAHASAYSVASSVARPANVSNCVSSQSAVCCSVPRSSICASRSSSPMSRRKSARISTVGASTGTPRSGS